MKSKSLLDLMPKEAAEKAIQRAEKRNARKRAKKGLDVSPEIFEVAEFGYYFGWDAVLAVRRGYTVEPVTKEKEPLTMAEVQVFLEGARKVWRTKLIEEAGANMASTSSAHSQTPSQSLKTQLEPLMEEARVKE